MRRLTTAIFVCVLVSAAVSAQTRVEKNVIYGRHSGLALLMDVHRPQTAKWPRHHPGPRQRLAGAARI